MHGVQNTKANRVVRRAARRPRGKIFVLIASIAIQSIACDRAVDRRSDREIVAAALDGFDQLERTEQLLPVLARLGPENVDEVAAGFESRLGAGAERGPTLTLLMEAWCAFDCGGAFARLQTWPMESRVGALAELFRPWARRDPAAARAAYEGLERQTLHQQSQASLMRGWAESGDPEMWDYVARLDPGIERENASRILMEAWLVRDGPDALLRKVETIDDDARALFKTAAFRTAAGLVVALDPDLARDFVQKHRGSGFDRLLISRVGERWARLDGAAALAWVRSLPPDREREIALQDTYRRWLVRDPAAAWEWMEGRADDPELAPLHTLYLRSFGQADPEGMLEWAGRIPDDALRRAAFVQVGVDWLQRDPEVARDRLDELGLLDAVLQEREAITERRASMREKAAQQRAAQQTGASSGSGAD